MYPSNLRYSKTHEWIRAEEGQWAVGITAYAAEHLGEVTYLELPEPGTEVKAGDEVGAIESVKAASEIYSPAGGTVAEVNEALTDNLERIGASPHDEAWFFKLTGVDEDELAGLMDAAAYEKYLAELDE